MLLSVIIPVYNSEKYISECLSSLYPQLNDEVEVILVDDASTDNSLNIINSFSNKTQNKYHIKIMALPNNKGVGYARSLAISQAKGEYICSVDPDDKVASNYIDRIINVLKEQDPDIVQFHISRFFDNKNLTYQMSSFFLLEGLYDLDGIVLQKFYEQSFWSFCTRVIRRTLFAKIDFSNLRNCEDLYALPFIFSDAKNIYMLDEVLYFYRLNQNSLSKLKTKKNVGNNIRDYNYIINNLLYFSKFDVGFLYVLASTFRSYIHFVADNVGFIFAYKEWYRIKKNDQFRAINFYSFEKKSHYFFLKFGVIFILLLKILGK